MVGFFAKSMVQVPAELEVHPEVGGSVEELGKPQSCTGGDAALSSNDFVNTLERDVDRGGEVSLSHVQRNQEFLKEHFAGMGGFSVGGGAHHV